jgi:hypothetical protein
VDKFSTIRGKCVWWREIPNAEDLYDVSVKTADKRIDCSCFVEGHRWSFPSSEVPSECTRARTCRYYVKGY